MEAIFEMIKNTLGTGTLKLVSIVMIIYFATVGISRLYDTFRRISSQKAGLERERSRLEILKIQYEIAALRKTHNINEILPPAETSAPVGTHLPERRPTITGRFSDFLLRHGHFGAIILYVTCGFLQLLGWLSVGPILLFLISLVRFIVAGYTITMESIFIFIAFALVGTGGLYQGLYGLGRRLRQHSSTGYRVTVLICLGLGIVASFFFLYMIFSIDAGSGNHA